MSYAAPYDAPERDPNPPEHPTPDDSEDDDD